MNLFKYLIALSIIVCNAYVDAMEKTESYARAYYNEDHATFYVSASDNKYSENDSNVSFFEKTNSGVNIISGSFDSGGWGAEDHSDDDSKKTIGIDYQPQRDFEDSRYDDFRMAPDSSTHEQNNYSNEDYQQQTNEKNDFHIELAPNAIALQENITVHEPLAATAKDLTNNLKSSQYRSNLVDKIMLLKKQYKAQWDPRDWVFSNIKKQVSFLDALLDGSINEKISTIQKGDFNEAQEAFAQLKKLWPWKNKNSFLQSQENSSEQRDFIAFIGVDVMQLAESILVSRKDYLTSYDISFESELAKFQKLVLHKQLNGDIYSLRSMEYGLSGSLNSQSQSKRIPLIKAQLVTIRGAINQPWTRIFADIKNAGFDQAIKFLDNFDMQTLFNIEQGPICTLSEVQADMREHHGFDLYDAAQKCLQSRSDYKKYAAEQKLDEIQDSISDQGIVHKDTFDMVSTTVGSEITINRENNQRIGGILDTLSDKSLESISKQIDTLNALVQKLQPEQQNKCFTIGLEASALLQKYIENPNQRIVANQTINHYLLNNRTHALAAVANDPTACRLQVHALKPEVCNLLRSHGIDPEQFTECIGNEVQQQLRAEFVSILNQIITVPSNTSTQPLLDMVTTCTYTGSFHAQQNNIEKAFSLADCAWAALDCATYICMDGVDTAKEKIPEIAEGILEGCMKAVYNTANMIIDPIGTLKGMREAFSHLGKCLVTLVVSFDHPEDLHLYDSEVLEAKSELRKEIVENITKVVSQMGAKEVASLATESFVSGLITNLGINLISHYAQTPLNQAVKIAKEVKEKVSDKSKKVFSAARQKVIEKLGHIGEKKPVMTTPEGVKVSVPKGVGSLHNTIDNVNEAGDKIKPLDYGHSVIQYEELKQALRIEEFTSIVKVTKHGLQRLMERYTVEEAQALFGNPTYLRTQADGAKVFIKEIGKRYNLAVINLTTGEVVTALNKIDKKAVINLGKNYGWEL
jgi:hypothetical protein